jgi:DNA polymerase-3 subunit beta
MKFTIKRDGLLPGLQAVNSVVERRHTLPILSNLLMEVKKKAITLTGTDMEVEIVVDIPQENTEEAEFTLPARKLFDICRALPEESELDFTVEKDRVVLRSGKSRFTLATLPAKEFPSTEISEFQTEIELEQKVLRSLLEDTMFAMAQQDVRYYLNGLLLEVDNKTVRAVATDGHRLALKEIEADTGAEGEIQIIIPRKAVLEIARLLQGGEQKTKLQIGKNHVRLQIDHIQFTSKLIDGKFPDYQRVVPEISSTPLKANREAFKQSLTRASILSNEKYRGVRLSLSKGNIRALAHNPEQEEAEESLDVEYEGEDMEIGFNVNYLIDAINAIKTENLIMTTKNPDSSCLLLPEDRRQCKYVVMPMRL